MIHSTVLYGYENVDAESVRRKADQSAHWQTHVGAFKKKSEVNKSRKKNKTQIERKINHN